VSAQSSLAAVVKMAGSILGDSSFTSVCTGGTFSAVPETPTFPYALVMVRESPGDQEAFGRIAYRVEQRVRIFSQYPGSHEVDAIASAAIALLHHAAATLTGWIVGLVHYVQSLLPVQADLDGVLLTYRDVVFEWLLEPSA
jgi:hypothetical protein